MGSISGYAANFGCDNLDPNNTYYVGVFGIGDAEDYTISAILHPEVCAAPRAHHARDHHTAIHRARGAAH